MTSGPVETDVKSRLGMAHFDPPERPTRPANPHYQKAQIERANEIWRAAIDPRETLVETYLRGRGLELLDELAGHVARFHPACPFGQGQHHPCMVTLFRDIASGKPVAIQRTALRPDGGKIGRKMMASTGWRLHKIERRRGCSLWTTPRGRLRKRTRRVAMRL